MNKGLKISLLFIIGVACLYESGLGIWQLLGSGLNVLPNSICTGTFSNPGPYGGFLAVCACTLGAFSIDKRGAAPIRLFTGVCAITALMVLPSTQSRAAILSLFCSALPALVRNPQCRNILKKYWIVLSILVVVLMAFAYNFKKPSADGRFFMDKICIKAMYDNGWKGVGLGNFGGAYGKAQHDYFKEQIETNGKEEFDWMSLNEHGRLTADSPSYAFNEYLSIGVEAGLFAMLLFMGLVSAAIAISFKRDTDWWYGLTAFAVFAFFSFPLHVRELQTLFLILIASCMLDAPPTDRSRLYYAGVVVVIVSFVALGTVCVMKYPELKNHRRLESEWKRTEALYRVECYECVAERGQELLPFMKNDRHFLFAYGQSLNKTGYYELSDSILELGTLVSADPMFWNVMGNNSMLLGKYREAEARYKYAFHMLPNRLYPLNLLAKLYYTEGDTAKFMDMANKVESFKPKIESANTERLRKEIRDLREVMFLIKQ